jgi:hypothetical protein
MSDIRQYLVTVSDDGLSVAPIVARDLNGNEMELRSTNIHELYIEIGYILYEGRSRDELAGMLK